MVRLARSRPLHHPAWFWWLAAMLLFKAAVPLLAVMAAQHRGVDLVEVCSVYGVRTVALGASADAADPAGTPSPESHADGMDHGHCTLGGLLGSALVLLAVLGWLLPAATSRAPAPHLRRTLRHPDPLLRWLGARLHAPPALS